MNQFQREFFKLRKQLFTYIGALILILLTVYSFVSTFENYRQLNAEYLKHLQPELAQGVQVQSAEGSMDLLTSMLSVLHTSHSVSWSMAIISTLGPIVACILGALIIGSEYRYGTIKMQVAHGPARTYILASKMLILLSVLVAFTIMASCTGLITVSLIGVFSNLPHVFGMVRGPLGAEFLATVLGLFCWGMVGFTFALIFRSTTVGIVVGIGWPILESTFLDLYPIRSGLPLWNQKAILAYAFHPLGDAGPVSFPLTKFSPSLTHATLVTVAYVVILVVVCLAGFERQEIA